MTEFTIRTMQPEDIATVARIQEAILGRPVASRWREALAQQLRSHPASCLVAVRDDAPIGYVIGEIKTWGYGLRRSGWVETVGVHPRRMGGGVGRALGRRLLAYFRAQGVDGIYTAVRWEAGDLLSFFKSLGFAPSGFLNLEQTGDGEPEANQ